eukprot:2721891-Karenia_brevis.AAC.1
MKMTVASTEQQRWAAKLPDEQTLTKDELEQLFTLFQKHLKDTMKGKANISSTEVKALLEDAIYRVKSPKAAFMNSP